MSLKAIFLAILLCLALLPNPALSQTYNWQASEEKGVAPKFYK